MVVNYVAGGEEAEKVVEEITSLGVRAVAHEADVSDEQAVLAAVELALEAGAPTKTNILNVLHRLIEGKPIDPPAVKPPHALTLTSEPQANVERYDALRQAREARHAS